VFVYSGELPNYLLKSWMTFQAAGASHIETVPKSREGQTVDDYKVENDAKEQISEWFKGKAFIYDNRIAENDDDEQIKLLELIEDVILQKGVSVILLDNLMTALDLDPGAAQDKYDRQGVFMKRLARLALKHNVLIILVAHKRKMMSSEVNDTISGSADIVNLASIVLSYERGGKEDDAKMRFLKVTKNRLFGELTFGKGIELEFDARSKRIYEKGNNGQLRRHFNWEPNPYRDFMSEYEGKELPFG
jgi:hypothetical protein